MGKHFVLSIRYPPCFNGGLNVKVKSAQLVSDWLQTKSLFYEDSHSHSRSRSD